MAYQKVGGTPRFYIDIPSYLNSIGVEYTAEELIGNTTLSKDLFGLNPSNPVLIGNEQSMSITINLPNGLGNFSDTTKGYFGMLNHSISDDIYFSAQAELSYADNIINSDLSGGVASRQLSIYNKGFSIFSYNETIDTNKDSLKFTNIYHYSSTYEPIPLYMGCITFGSYYDMPVSPDLDLSMEIEFDGVNNIKTLSGATITQANYQGSPWWYDADGNKREPWAIGESTNIANSENLTPSDYLETPREMSKRNGRRVWNLSFSYMSDKDLFASNYGSSTYLETNTDYDNSDLTTDSNDFQYTIDDDDSFSAQVLNKISHGQKFIFQPDNTNANPDQFAICVLDQDSFSMKRTAYNVYDISMKIKEVW